MFKIRRVVVKWRGLEERLGVTFWGRITSRGRLRAVRVVRFWRFIVRGMDWHFGSIAVEA